MTNHDRAVAPPEDAPDPIFLTAEEIAAMTEDEITVLAGAEVRAMVAVILALRADAETAAA